ncbi:MAG: nitroreductase family protein [bacterium]|nr:nitroreductase family protein [bacterium]
METLKAINLRKSVRSYNGEQIPEETLNIILAAGAKAPVASGKYDSLHITVIQDPDILKEIFDTASDLVFKMINIRKNMDFGAKTLILVSSTPAMMPGVEYANAACVLDHMILAATDQKVDNIIWGGAAAAVAQNESLLKVLEIPEGFKPLLCASFGYATEMQEPTEHTITINRI